MKNKLRPLVEILYWILMVGMTFLYSMLMLLIISFLFLSVIHLNIKTMFIVSMVLSAAVGIVYPIVRYKKLKQ